MITINKYTTLLETPLLPECSPMSKKVSRGTLLRQIVRDSAGVPSEDWYYVVNLEKRHGWKEQRFYKSRCRVRHKSNTFQAKHEVEVNTVQVGFKPPGYSLFQETTYKG